MMRAICQRLVGRRRCVVAAIVSAAASGFFAAPALGAVQWQITMTHANPYGRLEAKDPYSGNAGTFARESLSNAYTITVKNVGDEASQPAPVVVSDRFPEGIVTSSRTHGLVVTGNGWECKVPPGETSGSAPVQGAAFECERSDPVGVGESYPPITAEVTVLPDAAPPIDQVGTLTNVAKVAGDGQAAQTTQAEGETTITPAVPFGVDSFTVHTGEFKLSSVPEVKKKLHVVPPETTTEREEREAEEKPLIEVLTEQPEFDEADLPSLPTQAVPGINREFKPFSQAGGHPQSLVTAIALHQIPVREVGPQEATKLLPAGGNPKELEVEVPPGFIGNVLSMPRCPIRDMEIGGECPADTAVGFTAVDIGGQSKVKPGGRVQLFLERSGTENTQKETRGLVYNVQPNPGQPALFGFFVAKLPILLEVKLRSDGDYGVTVGTKAAGEWWPATDVTMCENGAAEEIAGAFTCLPVTAGSRPFLTNPAQCTAPSQWTLQANRWAEPNDVVSTSVHANVEARRVTRALKEPITVGTGGERLENDTRHSTLSGCGELSFEPQMSFAPTAPTPTEGGTTQADSPTGAAFDLTVPQASERADPELKAPPATPALKAIGMKLPAGMTISPSAANGLESCTNAQFWPGGEHLEPAVKAECPEASQIATVETFTPLLSGAPTIRGPSKEAGGELAATCSKGFWTVGRWRGEEEPELSYQWLVDGHPVKENPGKNSGAQRERFIFSEKTEEAEHPLQCEVIARTNSGSSIAVSQPVVGAPEFPGPFPPAGGLPAPSGSAVVGGSLTCPTGQWTNEEKFEYQWLRGAVAIPGTRGPTPTYMLTPQDAGNVVQCEVIATNSHDTAVLDSAGLIVSPTPSPAPPLPGGALQGQLYVAQPECNPCSSEDAQDGRAFRLFIQFRDPQAGIIVKLHGVNKVTEGTGQQETVFEQQPQQPFSLLKLKIKGGPTAPLVNPQECGTATSSAVITPWSTPETPNAEPSSSYTVEGCSNPMSFSPFFNAGTNPTTAGAPTNFSVTFRRNDGEQDLSGVAVNMPPGLVGKIPAVTLCGEAEALAQKEEAASEQHNRAHCPAGSAIGTATSLAGPGPNPYKSVGTAYLTGPIKRGPFPGAPFNLLIDTPAESPAFNLGHVVVVSGITINEKTAAVTATSEPLPQYVDGVQLRLREIHVEVNKPGFMLNPTNCNQQQVTTELGGLQGTSVQKSSNFDIGGCTNLLFHPVFTATTQAHTSKLGGASLNVKITYPKGYNYANIGKTITDLPIQLPSRLETLHKACPDTVFESNPAACPAGSSVGFAIAHTPVLNQPLEGPAILVSHGNRAFPDLEIVLQGEGVKVVLDGLTDIKKGITKTTFESVPDSPVESFELNLPEGSNSILAAPENLCTPTREATVKQSVAVRRKGHVVHVMKTVTKRVPEKLIMPTQLIGQNGAVIKQNTVIGVAGCPPTVAISKVQRKGNAVLVTVKMSAAGTVRISGNGLRTTTRKLGAGSHTIRVVLTAKGRSLGAKNKQTKLKVLLAVGGQRASANVGGVKL